MRNDRTIARLKELGFEWSVPTGEYLRSCNDGAGNYFLRDIDTDLRPMRKTGGTLTPIGELTLSVLKQAKPKDPVVSENISDIPAMAEKLGIRAPIIITAEFFTDTDWYRALVDSSCFILHTSYFISAEPTVRDTDEALAAYLTAGCDGVIGIGGGSVLDVAKITALRAANADRDIKDIAKVDSEADPAVPLILAPTTAGTGSEETLFAMAYDTEEDKKRPFTSDRFLPDGVVLDASLTLSVPAASTAFTGIDALSHAVEASLSLFAPSFPEDLPYAYEAARLIFDNLVTAVKIPDDLEARKNMLHAANLAGKAFRRISTGYIHAIAHRLGEIYHIPHGLAIAKAFTKVLASYTPYANAALAKLSRECGFVSDEDGDSAAAAEFIGRVEDLIDACGIDTSSVIIREEDIPEIVAKAQDEAKAIGYPRPFSDAVLADLIRIL